MGGGVILRLEIFRNKGMDSTRFVRMRYRGWVGGWVGGQTGRIGVLRNYRIVFNCEENGKSSSNNREFDEDLIGVLSEVLQMKYAKDGKPSCL